MQSAGSLEEGFTGGQDLLGLPFDSKADAPFQNISGDEARVTVLGRTSSRWIADLDHGCFHTVERAGELLPGFDLYARVFLSHHLGDCGG